MSLLQQTVGIALIVVSYLCAMAAGMLMLKRSMNAAWVGLVFMLLNLIVGEWLTRR